MLKIIYHRLDLLLKSLADQFSRQEAWQRYRDYDTALFEPGLSPEQRRLLFADAVAYVAQAARAGSMVSASCITTTQQGWPFQTSPVMRSILPPARSSPSALKGSATQ